MTTAYAAGWARPRAYASTNCRALSPRGKRSSASATEARASANERAPRQTSAGLSD
jgi:hypothetical protein